MVAGSSTGIAYDFALDGGVSSPHTGQQSAQTTFLGTGTTAARFEQPGVQVCSDTDYTLSVVSN